VPESTPPPEAAVPARVTAAQPALARRSARDSILSGHCCPLRGTGRPPATSAPNAWGTPEWEGWRQLRPPAALIEFQCCAHTTVGTLAFRRNHFFF
jgi:hypothetical protein